MQFMGVRRTTSSSSDGDARVIRCPQDAKKSVTVEKVAFS